MICGSKQVLQINIIGQVGHLTVVRTPKSTFHDIVHAWCESILALSIRRRVVQDLIHLVLSASMRLIH